MLTSAKRGKPINEEEIPPPVATGGKPSSVPSPESEPVQQREPPPPEMISSPPTNQKPLKEAPPPNAKPLHLAPPQKPTAAVSPGTPAISPLTPGHPDTQHSGEHIDLSIYLMLQNTILWFFLYVSLLSFCRLPLPSLHLELKQAVLSRQREFKLAAIKAKQSGNIEQAKQHYIIAKVRKCSCHRSYLLVCFVASLVSPD